MPKMNRARLRFWNACRLMNRIGDRADAAMLAGDPRAGRYWNGLRRAAQRCECHAARIS
jgi:hypothetical protein